MTASVLSHIAAAIPQKENLATEALAFILNRSPAARAALSAELASMIGQQFQADRILTQKAMGEDSRPDLLLFAADGSLSGFIEAKFWAALTASQPVEYVRQLEGAHGHGVLVMLAPERRLTTLRAEVLERCRGVARAFEPSGPWTLTSPTCSIGFLSWSRLCAVLSHAVAGDPPSVSDVSQLSSFCERYESEGFVPLTREDIDAVDIPRRIMVLAALVPEIVTRAIDAQLLSIRGYNPSHYAHASGRYAAFKQAGCWIGVSYRRWATFGRSPMWITFPADEWGRAGELWELLRTWAASDPPRAYRDDDGVVSVPLTLPVGVEKDVVVADVVRQLAEINKVIVESSLGPLKTGKPSAEPMSHD